MLPHHLAIIAILAVGFGLASLFAYIAQRLQLPLILGYLLAGFIIGPYFPGFVADMALSEQLAEIGVVLMLFGVGLHFKLEDLARVKNIAIPGAAFQTLSAIVFATALVYAAGWTLLQGLIIGLCIGVASTVVLVRVLTDNRLLNTDEGHIAVGWLVVEDIFTVIILVLLPTLVAFFGGANFFSMEVLGSITMAILKFAVLAFFMFTWGQKIVGYMLTNVARLRSQELLTLAVIAMVFIIAVSSAVFFGMSIALGAFIAGMVIGKTSVRHQAAANSLPLKDIFAIIFFLSVGMLFNPIAIYTHFKLFLGMMFIILLIKPAAAYLIVKCFGYPLNVALTVAVSLAQIGEFSFILAEEAMKLKMLPDDGFDILVACALISISINPILFKHLDFFKSIIQRINPFTHKQVVASNLHDDRKKDWLKVIIVGQGPIGKEVLELISKQEIKPTVIESNVDTVSNLEHEISIIYGEAANETILHSAHVSEASILIITIPDSEKTMEIIHTARRENPDIEIIARVNYICEKPIIEEEKVHYICTEGEALRAYISLTKHVLATIKG